MIKQRDKLLLLEIFLEDTTIFPPFTLHIAQTFKSSKCDFCEEIQLCQWLLSNGTIFTYLYILFT